MNCQDVRTVLIEVALIEVALIDVARRQSGDSALRGLALAHVEICSACAAFLADQRALSEGLAALRASSAAIETPARLEPALLEAFRGNARDARRSRVVPAEIAAAVVAAFGLVAALLLLFAREPGGNVHEEAAIERVLPEQLRSAPHAAENDDPIATEFVALPFAPAFTSYDRGQIVRVQLPRSSLRTFGFPVNPERASERVKADVVLGEDGIARAIRFVN
ncbi:MAG: hypothetical protein ACRD7E_01115 [Bryobacteraceae bacterium]